MVGDGDVGGRGVESWGWSAVGYGRARGTGRRWWRRRSPGEGEEEEKEGEEEEEEAYTSI